MTVAGQYQVISECAHVTMPTEAGPAKVLVYKHAVVPGDAPEIPHLLSIGFLRELDCTPVSDETGSDQGVENGDGEGDGASQEEQEIAAAREAAQAKLPSDGPPHGNAAQAVWVEYAVRKGSLYDDVKDLPRADLVELSTR